MGKEELENSNSERDNPVVNHALKEIAKDFGFPIGLRATDKEPQKWINFARNRYKALLDERGNMGNFETQNVMGGINYAKNRYERITAEVTELIAAIVKSTSQNSSQESVEESLQTLKEIYEDRESYRSKMDHSRKLAETARKLKAVENSRILQTSAVNFNKVGNSNRVEVAKGELLSAEKDNAALVKIASLLNFKQESRIIDEKHHIALEMLEEYLVPLRGEYILKMAQLKEKREKILSQILEDEGPFEDSRKSKNASENVQMVGNTIVDDMIKSRSEVAIQSKDWLDMDSRLEQVSKEGVKGIDRIKKLNFIIDEIAGRELTPENLTSQARECGDIEQYLGKFIKEFEPVRESYSEMKDDQKVMRRLHKKWDNRTTKAEKAVAEAQEKGLSHKAKEFKKLWEMAEAARIQMAQNVSTLDAQMADVTSLIHESNMAKTKLLSIIVSCNRFVRNYGTAGSPDSVAMKMLSTAFQNIANYENSLNAGKSLEKSKQMMEIF